MSVRKYRVACSIPLPHGASGTGRMENGNMTVSVLQPGDSAFGREFGIVDFFC